MNDFPVKEHFRGKIRVAFFAFSVLLLLLSFADAFAETKSDEAKIRIGVVLPLSGSASLWGDYSKKALELSRKHLEDDNVALELIYEDDACEPRRAVSAAKKLLDVDRVDAIIGAICSSATLAMAPIAQQSKRVLLTPCSEADAISEVGNFVFRLWTPGGRQAKTLASYLFNQLGLKTASILYINNDYGLTLSEKFRERFEELGGEVFASESYMIDPSDLKAELLRASQKKPEVLFLASHYEDAALALQQLQSLQLNDMQILGSSAMHMEELFEIVPEEALQGLVLANLADTSTEAFRAEYEKEYQAKWPGGATCAPQAYDALQLIVAGFRAKRNPEDLSAYLAAIESYEGVSGPIRFDENGDLVSEHTIYKVEGRDFVPVSGAENQ